MRKEGGVYVTVKAIVGVWMTEQSEKCSVKMIKVIREAYHKNVCSAMSMIGSGHPSENQFSIFRRSVKYQLDAFVTDPRHFDKIIDPLD